MCLYKSQYPFQHRYKQCSGCSGNWRWGGPLLLAISLTHSLPPFFRPSSSLLSACLISLSSLSLQKRYPQLIHSVRGLGTFCAIDCPTPQARDTLLHKLRNKGRQTTILLYTRNKYLLFHNSRNYA